MPVDFPSVAAPHAPTHMPGGPDEVAEYALSNDILNTNAGIKTTQSTTLIPLKATTLTAGLAGTLRISFEMQSTDAITATCEIWRGGVKVGTTQTHSAAYVPKVEDIAGWSVGDEIELRGKSGNAAIVLSVKNLIVKGKIQLKAPTFTANDP